MKILDREGISFCDVSDRHWYFRNGELSRSIEFWNKLNALMDLMTIEKPDQSFADFLASLPDDEATQLAKSIGARYVQGFHAARIERIGIHGLIKANEGEDQIHGDHGYRIPGGYSQVTDALCRDTLEAGAALHLNTRVNEIQWSAEGVEISGTVDGDVRTFQARCAVITLPLGVLQQVPAAVEFKPELPPKKREAISAVQMGHAIRIVLHFRERFWESLAPIHTDGAVADFNDLGFIHYPEAPLPVWWTQLHIRAPILVGWLGGPAAERVFENVKDELLAEAIQSLQVILRVSATQLREQLLSAQVHDWGADPFSRGAYSYLPVNGLAAQQALGEPIDDVLFFAGEATSVGHIGTVHGAIESGERAAREIIKSSRQEQ
jgi:monoamine oxidase